MNDVPLATYPKNDESNGNMKDDSKYFVGEIGMDPSKTVSGNSHCP